MQIKKLVVCPLVSRDVPKAIRAVNSIRNMIATTEVEFSVVAIINSLNDNFINDFSKWCEQESVQYKITPSKGTPAAGKNQCLKFFRESKYDGMCMVDGDDLYYPTAGLQIERHLKHHPGTDLLIVKPSDQINNNSHNSVKITENAHACCWGDNVFPLPYTYGPAQHDMFANRSAAHNLGGHVFYSRKFSDSLTYDEDQLLGEDLLLEFEALKLHQDGKLCFWLSFASDVQFLDRTGESNIQAVKNETDGEFYYNRLVEKVTAILDPARSSFNELPVEFPKMIFSHAEKIKWITKILST